MLPKLISSKNNPSEARPGRRPVRGSAPKPRHELEAPGTTNEHELSTRIDEGDPSTQAHVNEE